METIEIGSTPHNEMCASVGSDNYSHNALIECEAYRQQILRIISSHNKTLPDNFSIIKKSCAHDFGYYYEVACRFQENEESFDFFCFVESILPAEWDEQAKSYLKEKLIAA